MPSLLISTVFSETIACWKNNTMQEAGIYTGLPPLPPPIVAEWLSPLKPMPVVRALQQYYSQQVGLELLPLKKFYLKDIQQVYLNPNNEGNLGKNLLYVHSNNS